MRFHLTLATLAIACSASAAPVINEIFFRPPGAVENPLQEWVEIRNPDALAVDVSGWKFSKGVSFTIPAATSIPAGGYLVIASNLAAFNAAHPGFAGAVVGGWTGSLANGGERVQLDDALGNKVSDVAYADEGEWALRGRGDLTFLHRGWDWFCAADGGGNSFELRNPVLGAGSGQNWGVSAAVGGSPGAVNSVASANVAPLIKDAKHKPAVPSSTQPIVVSCNLEDEAAGAVATLFWRLDGGSFAPLAMIDSDGDGDVEASIPAQANLAIVEWYISATDGTNSRTWPAVARTSNPGILPETFGQVTNALVLVDNSFSAAATFLTPSDSPVYRITMTAADRNELVQIGTTNGQQESLATFNATFVSHDGTGVDALHNSSVRNRGGGDTALGPPNNYSVGFRSDAKWDGRGTMTINAYYPHSQALGNALFLRAGIPPQEAAVIRVRLNGVDMAEAGARMLGRYARLQGRNSDWAAHHYPNDPDGNFYRVDDHFPTTDGVPAENLAIGEFRYEGTNGANYADGYIKQTNQDIADYSDLVNLTRIISAPETGGTAGQPAITNADYPAALATVLDVDQVYRFIATDALIGNQEGGLQSGRADDFSMYRGVVDTRFRFVPHDMDDVFNIGAGAGDPITRSLFSYDELVQQGNTGVVGLRRMFNHPALVPKYYAAVLDAMNTWFNHATIDPMIDQIMTGWVPPATVTAAKGYIDSRRANVLTQIQQAYSLTATVGGTTTAEGYQRTLNGSATFSGTFNVAKTYSITVNGQLAQWFYRTSGTDAPGTWKMIVPAGGGTVLTPGLNRVVVKFWSAINGTGTAVETRTVDILWQPTVATYSTVSGTLTAGSLRLTAPATFIPGKPFLVRADVLDANGNVDRTAWDGTVNLSASVGGITLPNIQLFNGMGSALATAGGAAGLPPTVIYSFGTGGNGTTGSGVAGSQWKVKHNFTELTLPTFVTNIGDTWRNEGFDDSTWTTVSSQAGYGNLDENTLLPDTDYHTVTAGSQNVPCYLFRSTFTIADVNAITNITGSIKYDDAYAIYVNGVDINQRSAGLPAGRALDLYATATSTDNATAGVTIPASALHTGVNTIAVDIRQGNATSSDVTFDMVLQINYPAADPGSFTMNATYTGPGATFTASKALTSLTSAPAMTSVSGTLAAGTTTWSGVMNVTGNVTVPVGSTLNIDPGTHVLIAGDATAGSTAGGLITVNGTLNSNGTFAQPINVSALNAGDRFGGFVFSAAQPSAMNYTLINHAGHTAGVGHTSRGPMIRLTGSSLNFDDSVMADGPAKAMYTSGTCDVNIRRSLIERMITGPETENNTAILVEDTNIQNILPHYRESNANTPDDEDCLYIHNPAGRPVIMRRSVFARCGDDVFDGLGGPLVVEDSILREGWDKGMSLLNNDLTITRTMIINCDKAIVPKSQNADTRTVTANFVTIVSQNHDTTTAPWGYNIPPTSPDADTPSTGFYTQNKAGQSNVAAILSIVANNCIVIGDSPVLVDAPYSSANTVLTYTDTALVNFAAFPWPGTGNISADPLFASAVTGNYRITSTSPCRNTGDPATTDPDTTRGDMGALYFGGGASSGGIVSWTAAGGPYRVMANATVPVGTTLNVGPGTAVYFDQNIRLTVNGKMEVLGTPDKRVVFSHVPGTVAAGDADPIKNLVQTGPPKWGGIRVVDSLNVESVFKYCDFVNAQGTSPSTDNQGSLGIVRSWAFCEGLTFAGTHLRMLYGRNPKLTVIRSTFPDMMLFDPVLGRIEDNTDFLAAADNSMEPLKVEYPVDAASTGAAWTTNGLPIGGWWRVYYNEFNGNRGHNDVFDADSGSMSIAGDFLLDCRYNHFRGLSGDEHIDLGGDAYIASNIFEAATKDEWVSAFGTDNGYSNAISSGDKGTGTTIMVVRNTCYDLDHVINCKAGTAAVFEHNTVSGIHADYTYTPSTPDQDVKCAPINFFVPEDGSNPTRGDGAYMGFNLISNVPRLFSGPDARKINGTTIVNDVTTKIEFFHNQLDQILDPIVGPNHPLSAFSGAYGPNVAGVPGFNNPAAEDYGIQVTSLARRSAPGGIDYGATVPEWAYILGGPIGTTDQTSASFTIGGPGILSYKWRLNGGAWSPEEVIGTGGPFPRTVGSPCVRQEALVLTGLTPGVHTLEVLGRDMAGNWQDNDAARTVIGAAQAAPTVRTWTVNTTAPLVRINEVLANSATLADQIELHNYGNVPVTLTGWSLTDDALVPAKFPLPTTNIPAGGYVTFSSALLGLDKDGDAVLLYQGATQRDAVTFGAQIADFTLGRVIFDNVLAWKLGTPTLGAANNWTITGDQSGIRISEWFTGGSVLYSSDWIELSNSLAYPVDLAGLRITDTRSDTAAQHIMPPLSFIAANGFLKTLADGTGGNRLSFSLSEQQDDLYLADANGAFLDAIQYFQQTSEWSQGAGGTQYELPTAGLANTTTDANALALLRGLRISEIMFNALGGQDFEYVELTNIGGTALQLQNVKFVQGITFTFTAPTTLNAGESIVVVKNLTKFRSRYGNTPVVAGTYTGNLDNSGEPVAIQLPPPFDANILTFSYGDTWRLSADGGGTALTTLGGITQASLWGDKDTWTATALGGSPAATGARTDTFSGWMTLNGVNAVGDDNDRDGLAALIESALGMNPQNGNGTNGIAGAPVATSGSSYTFYIPENAGAAQGHGVTDLVYTVQSRADLNTGVWATVASKSYATNWTGTVSLGAASSGFIPVTITDPSGGTQRFFHLTITWAP